MEGAMEVNRHTRGSKHNTSMPQSHRRPAGPRPRMLPVAEPRVFLVTLPCPPAFGVNFSFFGVAAATSEGEGGESPAMVCPHLLRSPVSTLSLVPGAGLPAVFGVEGLADVRVSGRFVKSSAAESGRERFLASAAAVPLM
jgi:hypothetical protein